MADNLSILKAPATRHMMMNRVISEKRSNIVRSLFANNELHCGRRIKTLP